MYFSWLVFIALFTFAASTLYFYIFSRKQEKFMQYWGFSWIAYSMSLLCLLCFFASPNDLFLELRKVVDMFNLLLLLFRILFLYTYQGAYLLVPLFPVSAASCSDLHDLQLRSFILLSADFHISAYHYRISLL